MIYKIIVKGIDKVFNIEANNPEQALHFFTEQYVIVNKTSLVVITNEYFIYLQMFNFLDFCINEKNFEKSLLLCERLKNILNY